MAAGEFGGVTRVSARKWRARYMHQGAACSKTCPTKRAARRWLDDEEQLIQQDLWTPPRERERKIKNTLTVGQWVVECVERRDIRETTRATYMRTITNRILDPLPPGDRVEDITRLKDIPATELTKQDVYRWYDAIKRVYPDTHEQNIKAYKHLKSAYIEAENRDMVSVSPVRIPNATKRRAKPAPCLPTKEELFAILEHMPDRYKLFTVLLLFHGLRIGEAIALEVDDVLTVQDIKSGGRYKIQIRQNMQRMALKDGVPGHLLLEPTKTAAGTRIIDFLPLFNSVLERHMQCFVDSSSVVVRMDEKFGGGNRRVHLLTTTDSGGPVWDTSYRQIFDAAKRAAGIPEDRRITPHSGRRFLATQLAESGASIKTAGALMGDSDTDTILRVYMQVDESRKAAAMEGLHAHLVGGVK